MIPHIVVCLHTNEKGWCIPKIVIKINIAVQWYSYTISEMTALEISLMVLLYDCMTIIAL